jgi:hypothetical protein
MNKKETKQWMDETGLVIPANRITPFEKSKEKAAIKALNGAKKANTALLAYKKELMKLCDDVYAQAAAENNVKPDAKGNFVWYSFDRAIKIEVAINDRIEFDDLTITAAREKFNEFLDANIEGKVDFAKDLINDAFQTSRGKLDTKKIMSITKYRMKIPDAVFQEALDLLEKAIRRPDSKRYFRVWEKDKEGEYLAIDLNFSSISI